MLLWFLVLPFCLHEFFCEETSLEVERCYYWVSSRFCDQCKVFCKINIKTIWFSTLIVITIITIIIIIYIIITWSYFWNLTWHPIKGYINKIHRRDDFTRLLNNIFYKLKQKYSFFVCFLKFKLQNVTGTDINMYIYINVCVRACACMSICVIAY